jgi:hypothetical protein
MFELKWSRDKDGTLVTRRRKLGAHISRNEVSGFDWVIGIYPDKVFPWLLYSDDSGQTDTEEEAVEVVTELIVKRLTY